MKKRFIVRGSKIIDRVKDKSYPCLSPQAAKDLLPALEEHFAPKQKRKA